MRYLVVYDGHSGQHPVKFVKEDLVQALKHEAGTLTDPTKLFLTAFRKVDTALTKELLAAQDKEKESLFGTTALVAFGEGRRWLRHIEDVEQN
mmetsp:Transcript_72936/g.170895  ORF Transcript_72936/g.170895 Transcript_72936/m.170895 type:complete len:93 (-) Transcript_72936:421-699(-)